VRALVGAVCAVPMDGNDSAAAVASPPFSAVRREVVMAFSQRVA
jgi:hypothetical protein